MASTPDVTQKESGWLKGFQCHRQLIIVAALAVTLIMGIALCTYFGEHSKKMSDFFNGQIEIGNALLQIALPIIGVGFCVGLVLFIVRKHRKRVEIHEEQAASAPAIRGYGYTEAMVKPTIWGTLKTLAPNKSQRKILTSATLILTFFGLMLAVILMGDASSNNWFHHTFIPAMQNAMDHKIVLWQALADIGGSTFVVVAIINIAIQLFQRARYSKPLCATCNFRQDLDPLSSESELSGDFGEFLSDDLLD